MMSPEGENESYSSRRWTHFVARSDLEDFLDDLDERLEEERGRTGKKTGITIMASMSDSGRQFTLPWRTFNRLKGGWEEILGQVYSESAKPGHTPHIPTKAYARIEVGEDRVRVVYQDEDRLMTNPEAAMEVSREYTYRWIMEGCIP